VRRGFGDDPEAWFGLGVGLSYLGDIGGASASFWRVVDLLPTFWPAYFRIGELLERQLRFKDASKIYSSALDRAGRSSDNMLAEKETLKREVGSSSSTALTLSEGMNLSIASDLLGPLSSLVSASSQALSVTQMSPKEGVPFKPSNKPLKEIRVKALLCQGAALVADVILSPVLDNDRNDSVADQMTNAGGHGALSVAELRSIISRPGVEAANALDIMNKDDMWEGTNSSSDKGDASSPSFIGSMDSILLTAIHDLLGLEAGGKRAFKEFQKKRNLDVKADSGVSIALVSSGANVESTDGFGEVVDKSVLEQARKCLSDASIEDPNNAVALFGLGLCCELEGDWDSAVFAYRQHVRIHPKSANGYLRLSTLLRARGAVDEAVVALSIGMKLKPTQAGVVFRYAMLREAQGEINQAINAFKRTLTFDPQHVDAYFHLGRLLLLHAPPGDDGLPQVREATVTLERAVALDASQRDVREHLAYAYTYCGQRAAALRQRQAVLELFPEDTSALVACGMALEEVGKHEDADKCFAKASAIKNSQKNVAKKQEDETEPAQGILEEEEEEKKEPDEGSRAAFYHLGLGFARKGDLAKAVDCLRSATADLPSDGPLASPSERASNLGVAVGVEDAYVIAAKQNGGLVQHRGVSSTGFDGTEALSALGHLLLVDWEYSVGAKGPDVIEENGARGSRYFADVYRPRILVLGDSLKTDQRGATAKVDQTATPENPTPASVSPALNEMFGRTEATLCIYDVALQTWSPRLFAFGGSDGDVPNPFLEIWALETGNDEADLEPKPLRPEGAALPPLNKLLARMLHYRNLRKVSIDKKDSSVVVLEMKGSADQAGVNCFASNDWRVKCVNASDAKSWCDQVESWKVDWDRVAAVAAPSSNAATKTVIETKTQNGIDEEGLEDPKIKAAEGVFATVLIRDEANVGALMAIADIRRRKGLWRSAEPLLQRAGRLAPKDSCVAFALAQTLEKLGRVAEAAALYRTTNELCGADRSTNRNDESALDDVEEADESSTSALVLSNAASSYNGSSIKTASWGKELAGVACYRLGRLLLVKGQRLEALASLSRAVSLCPALGDAYAVLGSVLHDEGRDGAAIDSFRMMLGQGSSDMDISGGMQAAEIWYKLGLALVAKTKETPEDDKLKNEAVESLDRAVTIAERCVDIGGHVSTKTGAPWEWMLTLADALMSAGRMEDATRHLLIAADRVSSAATIKDSDGVYDKRLSGSPLTDLAGCLETAGYHLLRCWVRTTRSVYEAKPGSSTSSPLLLLAGGSANPMTKADPKEDTSSREWLPSPSMFISADLSIPAPPTEPITSAYWRENPILMKTRAIEREALFDEGKEEIRIREEAGDPIPTTSCVPPQVMAINRDELPPFAPEVDEKGVAVEWSAMLAEAISIFAAAQRLRIIDFAKRYVPKEEDEFGILDSASSLSQKSLKPGMGVLGASSTKSKLLRSVKLGGVVTDPFVITALGEPLVKPTLALGCALLGEGSSFATATAEALFAGLLASTNRRSKFPDDVKSYHFADNAEPIMNVRGDASVGLGLLELTRKGHAALAEKLLIKGRELGCSTGSEVSYWLARASAATVVAREPHIVPPGNLQRLCSKEITLGAGEGTIRGYTGLSEVAKAYRGALGLNNNGILSPWHALHAAIPLAGTLIAQGLLLEATKVSRRAVQFLEPILRQWVAPESEQTAPGSGARALQLSQTRDPFGVAQPLPFASPQAFAARAAKLGPLGRRRAEPLYRLAAAAHEALGDALLPRGLFSDAEEAYTRAMQWRREFAATAQLVGGGTAAGKAIAATVDENIKLPPGAAGGRGVGENGATLNTLVAMSLIALLREDGAEDASNLLIEALELLGEFEGGRSSAEAHLLLGDALSKLGRNQEALGEYSLAIKAIEGDADDGGGFAGDGAAALRASAYHSSAVLELKEGNSDEGAGLFSDAISCDPSNPAHFKGLGVALNSSGRWEAGGTALSVAAELSARTQPTTAATFAAANVIGASQGKSEGSQFMGSFRGDGLVSFHLGFSVWANGDARAAAERFGEATHMAPRYGGSFSALAALLSIESAPSARRDCDVARLAPDSVILALKMAAQSPSVVDGDGLRRRDACLEYSRRLKCINQFTDALSVLEGSCLKPRSGSKGKKAEQSASGALYNTKLVPSPLDDWADDAQIWTEFGSLYECLGRFAEAAEAYGRVLQGAPEYAVAEKAARECGAITTQRAVNAGKVGDDKNSVVDPADQFCTIPTGLTRFSVPEPPGKGTKILGRSQLATTPKSQVKFISAIIWSPNNPQQGTVEVDTVEVVEEMPSESKSEVPPQIDASDDKEGPARRPSSSLLDGGLSFATSQWASFKEVASDLDRQANTFRGEFENELGLAQDEKKLVPTQDDKEPSEPPPSKKKEETTAPSKKPEGVPPRLASRMPGLPPGWVAIVPLYGDGPNTPIGQDAAKSQTPLWGPRARIYYYHVGLDVTLRTRPETAAKDNEDAFFAAQPGRAGQEYDIVLDEDEKATRALHLSRYQVYATSESLSLPPQLAVERAVRLDLRRFAASRTHVHQPPTMKEIAADAYSLDATELPPNEPWNVVFGAFQPPFIDFEVAYDPAVDLPLKLKVKGVTLPTRSQPGEVAPIADNGVRTTNNAAQAKLMKTKRQRDKMIKEMEETAQNGHWVFVTGFAGHGGAERVGVIKPMDLILSVDGAPIRGTSVEAAINAIANHPEDKPLVLKFRRSLVISPPFTEKDPGYVLKTEEEIQHQHDLDVAKKEGVEKGAVLTKKGELTNASTEVGRHMYRKMSELVSTRECPLPPIAKLPFPAPDIIEALGGSTKKGGLTSLSIAAAAVPVLEGWVSWASVDGVHFQTLNNVVRHAWGVGIKIEDKAAEVVPTSSDSKRRGSLSQSQDGSALRRSSSFNMKRSDSFSEQDPSAPVVKLTAAAAFQKSLIQDPPRIYLALRRNTRMLEVSRSSVNGGVASAVEGSWDVSPQGRLRLVEVVFDPSVKKGVSKDAHGDNAQVGPLPWQMWLTFERSDLAKDINDSAAHAAANAARRMGGTGLIVQAHGAAGNQGESTGNMVGWDRLGDPFGGSAQTVVFTFPTEVEARHWAEAVGSVNMSTLKTTKPRRLPDRAPPAKSLGQSGKKGSHTNSFGELHGGAHDEENIDHTPSKSSLGASLTSRTMSSSTNNTTVDALSRGAPVPVSETESLFNPSMYTASLAGQGLRGGSWERLKVTIPRRAGRAMLLKLKGIYCKEAIIHEKKGGRVKTKNVEARTWPVITGFARNKADGKAGAAEASKQVKPLDILVAVDQMVLPRLDFLEGSRMAQAESTTGQEDSGQIVLTLWRNSAVIPPLAEGWVPHVVVLSKSASVDEPGGQTDLVEGGLLTSAPDAAHGLSPRRYLLLSKTGLLKVHAPGPQGALSADPIVRLHLRNVYSLQKVLDDATGRWQIIFWLKTMAINPGPQSASVNSGRSIIIAFADENDMLLWLDMLSNLKVATAQGGDGKADSDDEGNNDMNESKDKNAPVTVPAIKGYLPIEAEVMHVRSKGPRRLPRVVSNTQQRSGANAGRSTLTLLDSFVPDISIESSTQSSTAAQRAATAAAEEAAHSAALFAADPQAAISGIFSESRNTDDDTNDEQQTIEEVNNVISEGGVEKPLLSLNTPFFPDNDDGSSGGLSSILPTRAPPKRSRVAGLGKRR